MTTSDAGEARFLTLAETAELLAISIREAHALVRSGELSAIRIGSQGGWRVERSALEDFIGARYDEARLQARWRQAEFADVDELFAPRRLP